MKKQCLFIGLVSCLLIGVWILPSAAMAEESMEKMKIVREKIIADRKVFVASNLDLTEAEGQVFWPIYDSYVQDLQKLGARGVYIIEDFARNFEEMTDAKAKDLLDEFMAYEADYIALRQAYLPKFRKAIPEKKVTRYYQIENKIRAIANYEIAGRIPLMK